MRPIFRSENLLSPASRFPFQPTIGGHRPRPILRSLFLDTAGCYRSTVLGWKQPGGLSMQTCEKQRGQTRKPKYRHPLSVERPRCGFRERDERLFSGASVFGGSDVPDVWPCFWSGRGITSEGRPRTIVFPVPASTDWRRRSCIRTGFPSSSLAAFARFRNAAVSPRAFSRIAWPSFCALTTCAKIYFRSPGNMISLTSTTVRVNPRPLVFGSVFSNRALPISCRMVMTSSIFSPPTSSRRASCRIM